MNFENIPSPVAEKNKEKKESFELGGEELQKELESALLSVYQKIKKLTIKVEHGSTYIPFSAVLHYEDKKGKARLLWKEQVIYNTIPEDKIYIGETNRTEAYPEGFIKKGLKSLSFTGFEDDIKKYLEENSGRIDEVIREDIERKTGKKVSRLHIEGGKIKAEFE